MTGTANLTPSSGRLRRRGRSDPLPGFPQPVATWATRADLLGDRAEALRVLDRADMSLRTVLGTWLLLVPASVAFAFSGFVFAPNEGKLSDTAERSIAVSVGLVCFFVGVFFTWRAWRRTLRARDIGLRRRAWEDLADDPAARALPRGDLDPALREPFDARNDPDADYYIPIVIQRLHSGTTDDRLLARAALTGLAFVPAMVGVLGPIVSWDPIISGFVPIGVVLSAAVGIQFVKGTQRGWRCVQRWKHANREYQQWRAERPPANPL